MLVTIEFEPPAQAFEDRDPAAWARGWVAGALRSAGATVAAVTPAGVATSRRELEARARSPLERLSENWRTAEAAGLDVESSASRQHWIDTGTYLAPGEAIPPTEPAEPIGHHGVTVAEDGTVAGYLTGPYAGTPGPEPDVEPPPEPSPEPAAVPDVPREPPESPQEAQAPEPPTEPPPVPEPARTPRSRRRERPEGVPIEGRTDDKPARGKRAWAPREPSKAFSAPPMRPAREEGLDPPDLDVVRKQSYEGKYPPGSL